MKSLAFLVLTMATATAAPSTISNTDRYPYAANAGWIDLYATGTDGVRVYDTVLAGSAYAANFGWIDFGNGTPTNFHTYSNATATDFGVNVNYNTGALTGYAYAANIGWITFEQTYGFPKIDLRTGIFSGSAYSANIGWIALDTTFSVLDTITITRPDTDGDGIADGWEYLNFGDLSTANAASDNDKDGATDLAEYLAGTNPKDPTSRLSITAHTYNAALTSATLTFTTLPTRNYRIEYDTDLIGTWTNSALGTFSPTRGSVTTKTLAGLLAVPRRFFRVAAVALPSTP